MKRTFRASLLALATAAILLLAACGGVSTSEHQQALDEAASLASEVALLQNRARDTSQALEEAQSALAAIQESLSSLEAQNDALASQVETAESQKQMLIRENENLQAAAAAAASKAANAPAQTVQAAPEAAAETTAVMVWIPRTGSKYHSKSSCSNMKDPSQVTQEQAINQGYGRCSKCW